MPRITGYRERIAVDVPIHIAHLDHESPYIFNKGPDVTDFTVIIVDLAASRSDITIDIATNQKFAASVSGPWLTDRTATTIFDILSVANDAVQEGKEKSAIEIIAEAINNGGHSGVLRPIVVPVRQGWQCTIRLNEGALPGPVDVWIRTLKSRDVA